MQVIGIICEYNPFHNGHIYHIKKIKEKYPDSLIILVLNGYFLQRGELSILTKEQKTKISLEHNIDIVLELPIIFGTQSADIFAQKSIELLNYFCCNKIIFGSESNDKDILEKIAKQQINNKEYDSKVQEYLNLGYNYPTSLAKALDISNFEFLSNDLLGISYIKAILKNNYSIEIETIKRTNNYKDTKSNNSIISASNIREKIDNNININKFVPIITLNNIININYDRYFQLLKYKINTELDLSKYLDVDEGIENRLQRYINKSNNIKDFIENIKTKRYTYNKINRMLIHILLGITKESNKIKELDYIKILGFNKNGQKYIRSIKNTTLPLKPNIDSIIYKYELKAALVYDLINNTNTYEFEIKNKPIQK